MVSLGRKKKRQKVKDFVREALKKGVTSPAKMREDYNKKFGLEGDKALGDKAFTMAMRRMGISAKKRLQLKHKIPNFVLALKTFWNGIPF